MNIEDLEKQIEDLRKQLTDAREAQARREHYMRTAAGLASTEASPIKIPGTGPLGRLTIMPEAEYLSALGLLTPKSGMGPLSAKAANQRSVGTLLHIEGVLTPMVLLHDVAPVLNALANLQILVDEMQGYPKSEPKIIAIEQITEEEISAISELELQRQHIAQIDALLEAFKGKLSTEQNEQFQQLLNEEQKNLQARAENKVGNSDA